MGILSGERYILGVLSQFLGVTGIIVSEISLYSIYSISDQPISLYSINSIIVCPYGHCKIMFNVIQVQGHGRLRGEDLRAVRRLLQPGAGRRRRAPPEPGEPGRAPPEDRREPRARRQRLRVRDDGAQRQGE